MSRGSEPDRGFASAACSASSGLARASGPSRHPIKESRASTQSVTLEPSGGPASAQPGPFLLVGVEGEQQSKERIMTKMTEFEAWKLIYAWTTTVPTGVDPHFKEARALLRKFIKRVEKGNNEPAAAMRMIHEAMVEQGHVLVWSASAEEVRRFVRLCTGCEKLPPGFSNMEIVKELKPYVRRYVHSWECNKSKQLMTWSVAHDMAIRAGLEWKA
jgi:hypothetical protein